MKKSKKTTSNIYFGIFVLLGGNLMEVNFISNYIMKNILRSLKSV